MSRPVRRSAIPLSYQDLNQWPGPDLTSLSRSDQDAFCKRRNAIELYARGCKFDEIYAQTGVSKAELHRQLKRCLNMATDGAINGFRALVPRARVAGYTRTLAVRHQLGSGPGGCAGALSQLLAAFPEIADLLDDLYFKQHTRGTMPEARAPLTAIHDRFKAELRKRDFTDEDWPFNTGNCGYKSLWQYFKHRRDNEAQRAALPRSGAEAARRHPVGNGMRPLLPCIRTYNTVHLDFHKIDAASVFVIKNDYGEEFEVPMSRWHFGLLVEEKHGPVLGFCIALELTPSGDSTLEVISSALSAQPSDLSAIITPFAGKVLIHHFMPELAYQGFSVLKVDNGWSNAAHEVVNNIITTIGCAVNFGPTRAWWRRNLIERIFGELTRRGLQRMPSTFGKGPDDTRKNNPNAQAAKFRIEVSDLVLLFQNCLREHNTEAGEGRQWTSPLKCLQAAYANPSSGFFSQPLPLPVQARPMLMMHVEQVTVLGDPGKNVRPYFNLDRHKHTNEILANAFWLIGMTLIVYVDRRLARIVYATVKETGEQLGLMRAAGPWAHSDCSWRDRKLLTRAGMARRNGSAAEDPLEEIKRMKIEQLKDLNKSGRRKSSRTALEVAKIEVQQKRAAHIPEAVGMPRAIPMPPDPPPPSSADPFGLNTIPNIGTIERLTP